MEKLSQRKFSERTGISRDTLIDWDKRGILSPIEKHGERKASYYSEEQIELALKIPRRGQKTTSDETAISLFDENNRATTNDASNDDERNAFDLLPELNELNDLDEPEPVEDVAANAAVDAVDARHTSDNTSDVINPTAEQNAPVDAYAADKPATFNELVEPISGVVEVVAHDVTAKIITLDERANRIRRIQADVKATVEAAMTRGAFEIGAELIEAKKQVPHGQWSDWLARECGYAQRTAQNLMAISERFANTKTFSHLNQSTLIKLLALPVGDEQAFIDEQDAAGNPIGEQSARQLQQNIKTWKEKKTPTTALHDDTSESPAATSSFQENETPADEFILTPDEPPSIDELETLRGKIYSELNSIRAHVQSAKIDDLKRILNALADLV